MWQKGAKKQTNKTSWEPISNWYGQEVGLRGHYYHQNVIWPNLLRIAKLKAGDNLLDIACGQGVLERVIPKDVNYVGIDASEGLINQAKKMSTFPNRTFIAADCTKDLSFIKMRFDWITIVLALQNIAKPFAVIRNASKLLKPGGRIIIVLNHPSFRIPKNSDWIYEENEKKQYRKIGGYMTPKEIKIESSPFNKKDNSETFSYHYPLSGYAEMIADNGLVISAIEEWISDKKSTGSRALAEDKARKEFPLFMTIVAKANS